MTIIEGPTGTTVITHYRCRECGFEGRDSRTHLGAPGEPHRPIVYATWAPFWCPEHGRDAMDAYEPEAEAE